MSARAAYILAWGLWVACVALVALSCLFAALNGFSTPLSAYLPNLLTSALSFSTVGATLDAGLGPDTPEKKLGSARKSSS